MYTYTKFLKEILFNKSKLEDHENVALVVDYNTLIQNKFPLKFKDPESISIPRVIGTIRIGKLFIPTDFVIMEI